MKLDRTYQREFLQKLAQIYPQRADVGQLFDDSDPADRERYAANLFYLQEHGLAESATKFGIGNQLMPAPPRVTAKGMDFLADDGGLSAILGVVTVKLHEDTLKELIGKRIDESDLPVPEKSRLLEQLKSLPAEAIKHLSMKLIDLGLSHSSSALPLLEQFIHRVAS